MARVRVDLTEPLLNGMDIKFKAPSDCTAVNGLIVYAPDNNGGISSQVFTFKDAHGNTLTGLGNLFAKNALVKVMVDTDSSAAYIQNADTNKYLEDRFNNTSFASGSYTKFDLSKFTETSSVTLKYERVGKFLHCRLEVNLSATGETIQGQDHFSVDGSTNSIPMEYSGDIGTGGLLTNSSGPVAMFTFTLAGATGEIKFAPRLGFFPIGRDTFQYGVIAGVSTFLVKVAE